MKNLKKVESAYAKYSEAMAKVHAKYFFPATPFTEAQIKRGAITPDCPGPRPGFSRKEYLTAWGETTKAYYKAMKALGYENYEWVD